MKCDFFSNRWLKVLVIFFAALTTSVHAEEKIEDGISLVKAYVQDMGNNILEHGYSFQKYYHPDYVLLGGEGLNFLIVDKNFTVKAAKEKYMTLNLRTSKREKVLAVTIEFKQLGRFSGTNVHLLKKKYDKTFFCSKSTGSYLIINTTDNEQMVCFYDAALNWVEKKSQKNDSYNNAYKVLKAMK